MKLKDEKGWTKAKATNMDPYGGRVMSYAEDWANFMEREMAVGKTIAQCARSTSQEADTDGITGFMYGAAVGMLAAFWDHGEELRRWHNLDIQLGAEGESANASGSVLNPALLNIGEE